MRHCLVCGREFQPPAGRGRPPETCSPEHAAIRKMEKRRESRNRAIHRGVVPERAHGTSTGYTYYGCTCAPCRKWARSYKQSRRNLLKAFAGPHDEGESDGT